MMKGKRYFGGILCAVLILNAFASAGCAKTDEAAKNEIKTETAASETAEETTSETRLTPNLPDSDFQGYEFTIMARGDNDTHWKTKDVESEGENGEPINDAVYKRNLKLSEKYDVVIKQTLSKEILNDIKNAVLSGSAEFDAAQAHMQNSASLASQNLLLDLFTIPYLDFEQPWWDGVTDDSMTILNHLFFACGDINLMDNDATWVVFFNKRIYDDYGIDDPYAAVGEGKWTIDRYYEICRKTTRDLNGDGELTPEDQWGAVNQYECASALYTASGELSVIKDGDGLPSLNLDSERAAVVMEKVYAFMSDKTAQIKADDYSGKYPDEWVAVNVNGMKEGRATYYMSPMTSIQFFRDMEDPFGILPMPKYDESQENYVNVLQYNNASVYSVPATCTDTERAGIVLEAMAAESMYTVTPAYYDVTLKRKITRDDESSEMLDLIFATRVVDLGFVFNWGSAQGMFGDMVKAKTFSYASTVTKNESKIQKEMQKTLDAFAEF